MPSCGYVAYVNPRLVVTTIPINADGEVVLLRRGIEPGKGWWAQPGGFLEVDETVTEAAIRETLEETGLVVEPGEIVGLYSRLEAAVVVIAFEARVLRRRIPPQPRGARDPGVPPRGDPVARHRVQDDPLGAARLGPPAPARHPPRRAPLGRLMADAEWIRASYTRMTLAAYRKLAERGGGAVVEEAGLMLLSGPHPHALITNAAFRIDPGADPSDSLKRAREHYAELGYGFAFNTSADRDADLEEAATAAGWVRILDLPAMIVEAPIATPATADGPNLRWADPTRDRRTFGEVAGATLADDELEAEGYRMLFADGDLLGGTDIAAVIASVDGRDVAVAWVVLDDDAGLVGWVGTLPDYRRRGLGALVTQAVTNEAFERGARIVVLQASPQGLPVYERLGYRTIGLDRVWLPPG